jgi:hypothetical protein
MRAEGRRIFASKLRGPKAPVPSEKTSLWIGYFTTLKVKVVVE